jgi:hypothetical protein
MGQVPAAQLDTGVNPAVFEIAGHMVLKRAQDYEVCARVCVCAIVCACARARV